MTAAGAAVSPARAPLPAPGRALADRAVEDLFHRPTVDELLTTTRSVRRRLDLARPVPPAVIQECLELAVHAPTANNRQSWRWVVVTDPAKRADIAAIYRDAWSFHRASSAGRVRRGPKAAADARNEASVAWLADHLHEVPALVIPCVIGRPPDEARIDEAWRRDRPLDDPARAVSMGFIATTMFYGSIYPAVWSFQLALRSRGLGSVITCMHLPCASSIGAALGIPTAVTQVCLVPVAYTKGIEFRPSPRVPAADRTYWDHWGEREPGRAAAATGVDRQQ